LIEHYVIEHYTFIYLPDKNISEPSLACVHLLQTNAHKPWILGILSVFKDLYVQTTSLLHFKQKNYSAISNMLLEALNIPHVSSIITACVSTGVKLTDSPLVTYHHHHHHHHHLSRVRP